ncbi:ABC transporter permease [Hirschia litorea]|uniref:ABC transporter permease n=1 Tax=Hirschia litorea TaxID=1199156 RepID=A0ABW2IPS1_9PROT
MGSPAEENKKPLERIDSSYRVRTGFFAAIWIMWVGVFQDRRQIWVTSLRNIRTSYSNTVLGFGWAVIMPLVPVSAYILIGILFQRTRTEMPYLMFVTVGLTIFLMVTWPIAGTITAVRSDATLLSRSNVRMTTIVLSAFGNHFWATFIRIFAIIGLFFYFSISFEVENLLFLFILIPGVLLSFGLGAIGVVLNSLARDTENIIGILMRYLVFFSGVVIPLPKTETIQKWIIFNPFYTYVNEARSLLVHGFLENPTVLYWTMFGSIVFYLIMTSIMYRIEPRIRVHF